MCWVKQWGRRRYSAGQHAVLPACAQWYYVPRVGRETTECVQCVPGGLGCDAHVMTACRVGMGVTGGTPFGFDVGQAPGAAGGTMAGIDLGVRGMRVGGIRKLKVPPNLAYGNKQVSPCT